MTIDCPNAQYISRNIMEIAEVIIRFKELDATYSNNLSLYLDSQVWEVFDIRRSITLIRHDFKHVRQLLEDMKILNNDFVNVYSASSRLAFGKNPTTSEAASIKHIYCVYGLDTFFFKTSSIKNYIYGKFKEEKNS